MHDTSKVLLGQVPDSVKDISTYDSDPANTPAGTVVSLKTDGSLSVDASDGMRIGISIGKGLSDEDKTQVCRDGLNVPLRMALKRARATATITSYANLVSGTDDSISIAGTAFTAQTGAVTPGGATFQAATGNSQTAASLAAQINAHATVSLKVKATVSGAVVTLWSVAEGVGSTGTGNDIAVSYTDNDTNVGLTLAGLSGGKLAGGSDSISAVDYIVKGAKVYINDATGMGDTEVLGTISDAVYRSLVLTGTAEDGSSVAAALVDMPGGV